MIWERRCPIHGERAKPLDRVAWLLMLIVVCCVCVCGFVLCVGSTLATIPVESQHQPRQNGQLLHTRITKPALKHPKYGWMCKHLIIQRCCIRFVVRARQERRRAPCIDNSFSHDDGCTAQSSFSSLSNWQTNAAIPPPITIKLAHAYGSALPLST
jgi:hypothetical protein